MASTPIPSPTLTLGAVNMLASDPTALAAFWSATTGGSVKGSHEGAVYVEPAPGGIPFFFQPVGDERPDRATIHLDLTAEPGTREAEVARLSGLGAVRRWDVIGEVPWVDWTTMADPEGNLFCVAEHRPAD